MSCIVVCAVRLSVCRLVGLCATSVQLFVEVGEDVCDALAVRLAVPVFRCHARYHVFTSARFDATYLFEISEVA
eukprot:152925-Pyramimonas_sp.AAC.1